MGGGAEWYQKGRDDLMGNGLDFCSRIYSTKKNSGVGVIMFMKETQFNIPRWLIEKLSFLNRHLLQEPRKTAVKQAALSPLCRDAFVSASVEISWKWLASSRVVKFCVNSPEAQNPSTSAHKRQSAKGTVTYSCIFLRLFYPKWTFSSTSISNVKSPGFFKIRNASECTWIPIKSWYSVFM